MSVALVNHLVRRKDKVSSSSNITIEVLTAGEIGPIIEKSKGDIDMFKIDYRKLRKKHCAFCKEEGH